MSNNLPVGAGRKIFSTHGGRNTFVTRLRSNSVDVFARKNGKDVLVMVVKSSDLDAMPSLVLVKEALESHTRLLKMKRIWIVRPLKGGAVEISVGEPRSKRSVSDPVRVTSAQELRKLSERVMREATRTNNASSAATSKELRKLANHFA